MTSTLVTILNFNGISDTLNCLNSLSKQSYKDFEVLIIDNGSHDSSVEVLKDFSIDGLKTTLLFNERNLGFAGGVNQGIKYANSHDFKYVALFNNDAIAKTDWLENLVSVLDNKPEVSIVTSLLLDETGAFIDSTAEQYSNWGVAFPLNRKTKIKDTPESDYIFGATGGASLYRVSLFNDIGLFDENFFAYYEDVDLSFRAQLFGYKIYFTNNAIAYHKQGATSKKIPGFTVRQIFKNIPQLYIKNVPATLLLPIGIRLSLLYWLMFGNAVKNGSGLAAVKGWLQSIWFFWTSSVWQRSKIQANKKVTTEYIKSILYKDLPPDQTGMRNLRKRFTGKN